MWKGDQRREQLELQHPVLLSLLLRRGSCELPESGRFSRCTRCITHVRPSGSDSADSVTFPCRKRPETRKRLHDRSALSILPCHCNLRPLNTDPDRLALKSPLVELPRPTILQGTSEIIRQSFITSLVFVNRETWKGLIKSPGAVTQQSVSFREDGQARAACVTRSHSQVTLRHDRHENESAYPQANDRRHTVQCPPRNHLDRIRSPLSSPRRG